MIALNFASESEANNFYKIATGTIANRNKRRQVTNSKFFFLQLIKFKSVSARGALKIISMKSHGMINKI